MTNIKCSFTVRAISAAAVFFGVLAISPAVFAESKPLFPVLACPAIGDEYEQMISKLDSIKTSIRQDANCENVNLKVESLEKLVTDDRERILAIVSNSQGAPLTPEQTASVREYAENVTKKVAALNDLFTQSNYCFKDDNAETQLSSLAGFVGEAANMVGSISGPWGTPIALAGNVIAGFMKGLDTIFKSRAGFDFSKREQWIAYVQNLCTYHSYRDQIEHLLNPAGRLAQLNSLKTKLDFQIMTMSKECSDCRAIESGYIANRHQSPPELVAQLGGYIASADSQNKKPYGSYMIQSLGLRDWAVGEMIRVKKEANTYWADATGRHILTQAKNDIEQFLIEKEAPKFLGYGVMQSRRDYEDFTYMVAGEGRQVYATINRANREILGDRVANLGWSDPLVLFRALILQPLDWNKLPDNEDRDELQFVWTHFRDQSLDRFRTSVASTQVVQSFCSFFKHSGFYSPEVRSNCSSTYFKKQIAEQNVVMNDLISAKIDMGPLNGTFKTEEEGAQALTPIESILREIEIRNIGN